VDTNVSGALHNRYGIYVAVRNKIRNRNAGTQLFEGMSEVSACMDRRHDWLQ